MSTDLVDEQSSEGSDAYDAIEEKSVDVQINSPIADT